jgi:hypothetical protein
MAKCWPCAACTHGVHTAGRSVFTWWHAGWTSWAHTHLFASLLLHTTCEVHICPGAAAINLGAPSWMQLHHANHMHGRVSPPARTIDLLDIAWGHLLVCRHLPVVAAARMHPRANLVWPYTAHRCTHFRAPAYKPISAPLPLVDPLGCTQPHQLTRIRPGRPPMTPTSVLLPTKPIPDLLHILHPPKGAPTWHPDWLAQPLWLSQPQQRPHPLGFTWRLTTPGTRLGAPAYVPTYSGPTACGAPA